MTEAQGDRELDAWLAEHLLGQRWGERWTFRDGGGPPDLSGSGDGMLLVLGAVEERGWEWALSREGRKYYMRITDPSQGTFNADGMEDRWLADERAGSAPMAVALAARAALEAEGGDS